MSKTENDKRNERPIEWEKAYASETFQTLKRKRFAFVIPTIVIFCVVFFTLFTIQNYYRGLANMRVFGWINVAFLYTMLLFPIIWGVGIWFTMYISKNVSPREEEIIKRYGGKEVE